MQSPLSFLNKESFQTYSRIVAAHVKSVTAAILLSELINRFEYHLGRNELESHPRYGEGWFYFTIEKCEERTCLSRKEQDHALKVLKENGFLETVCFGLPAKRYFKLNIDKILEVFGLKKIDTRLSQKDKLDCTKGTNFDVPKGQTIYKNHIKNPKEEPYLTTTTTSLEKPVVVAVDSDKSVKAKKEAAASIQAFLANRSRDWGDAWIFPVKVIESLMRQFGIEYVQEQVNYMLNQHTQSIKDEKTMKKTKTRPIDKPETFLKIACDKNYAKC